MVEAKHAAETLTTSDGSAVAIGRCGRLDKPAPKTLMWAFFVVMANELLNAMPQVSLPERDDLRQTPGLDVGWAGPSPTPPPTDPDVPN